MIKMLKWKKTLPLAVAAGVMCLSAYGIYHTADAYSDLQAPGDTLITEASSGDGLTPGGTVCNPLGCAACAGCTDLLYQETIEAQPDSGVQLEQIG